MLWETSWTEESREENFIPVLTKNEKPLFAHKFLPEEAGVALALGFKYFDPVNQLFIDPVWSFLEAEEENHKDASFDPALTGDYQRGRYTQIIANTHGLGPPGQERHTG